MKEGRDVATPEEEENEEEEEETTLVGREWNLTPDPPPNWRLHDFKKEDRLRSRRSLHLRDRNSLTVSSPGEEGVPMNKRRDT